jgi:hypothetical protein
LAPDDGSVTASLPDDVFVEVHGVRVEGPSGDGKAAAS